MYIIHTKYKTFGINKYIQKGNITYNKNTITLTRKLIQKSIFISNEGSTKRHIKKKKNAQGGGKHKTEQNTYTYIRYKSNIIKLLSKNSIKTIERNV